jgi:ABC-type xylose transport system permease subunit
MMDSKLKIIFGLAIVLAFVLGLMIGGSQKWLLIVSGIAIIIAFIGGLLVYRKNAKKFQKLEDQAKADLTISTIINKL